MRYSMAVWLACLLAGGPNDELEQARNRQDRVALEKIAGRRAARAQQEAESAEAHYELALAESYRAQVAMELGDKAGARSAAESGISAARRAVSLRPGEAEYHRLLGTLCGQVIPADVLAGLKHGRCAVESVNKALELAPTSSLVRLSRGIGNYYLSPMFGGGVEPAIRDFEEAIRLDPNSAEAHLWLGIAMRKAGRTAEARKAIARSLALNPHRAWAKQQLEKTPAQ